MVPNGSEQTLYYVKVSPKKNPSNFVSLIHDSVMWFALRVMPGIGDVVVVADRILMVYRTDWSRDL
jgi:hypothetical protein